MKLGDRELLTLKQLIEGKYVHCGEKQIRRYIKYDGFPNLKSGPGSNSMLLFDLKEVALWYKKRETKAS